MEIYEIKDKNDYTFKLYKDTLNEYSMDLNEITCRQIEQHTKRKIDRDKSGIERFHFPIYILVDDDKLLGYCDVDYDNYQAFIHGIYIASNYRGRGYMTKLLDHVRKIAADKKLKVLSLSVYVNNPDAHLRYEKYGFRDTWYNMTIQL